MSNGQRPETDRPDEQESKPLMYEIFHSAEGRRLGRVGIDTRADLLAALKETAQDTAWHQVKVVDIAARANCSPATFYQYFPSLGAAFDTLCEQIIEAREELAPRILKIAELRALETGRPLNYTPPAPDPAQVGYFVPRHAVIAAVTWTGENEAEVQKLTGSSDFWALDEDDRSNSDDPEATATLMTSKHSEWKLVYTGWVVVRDAHGDLDVLTGEEFAARCEAAPVAADHGEGGQES